MRDGQHNYKVIYFHMDEGTFYYEKTTEKVHYNPPNTKKRKLN